MLCVLSNPVCRGVEAISHGCLPRLLDPGVLLPTYRSSPFVGPPLEHFGGWAGGLEGMVQLELIED